MLLTTAGIFLWVKLYEAAKINDSTIDLSTKEIEYMLALYSLTILASLAAMYGASQFTMFPIQSAAFVYIAQLGLSIWQYVLLQNWIALSVDVIGTALWMYPHAVFLKELDSGVLTKASYEPQSICCTSSTQKKVDAVQSTFKNPV